MGSRAVWCVCGVETTPSMRALLRTVLREEGSPAYCLLESGHTDIMARRMETLGIGTFVNQARMYPWRKREAYWNKLVLTDLGERMANHVKGTRS